jgi:hypothetical protein
VIETNLNSTPVALQAIHEAAKLAQDSLYLDARILLVSTQRLLQRAMKNPQNQKDYMNFVVQAEKLDQFMREAQQQDSVFAKNNRGEKRTRDDESSKAMFQMKSVSVNLFENRK